MLEKSETMTRISDGGSEEQNSSQSSEGSKSQVKNDASTSSEKSLSSISKTSQDTEETVAAGASQDLDTSSKSKEKDTKPSIDDKGQSNNEQSNSNEVSKPAAVVVESASKTYGSGKHKHVALDDLQMRVPHGAIYGLLGPSGCGKTTLLSCMVDRLKLDSGKILLFGFEPGSAEASVPGERVGFMPQELALYQEFTIRETFEYFGHLVGLQRLTLNEKTEFLIKFLDLPSSTRKIDQLSGGQQRRVSLACAILHEPELLILDEPTVGVDPLLRNNIWNHLVQISKWNNATIIITTHYIEEAKQADKIGLMRQGRLLAESSPQNLLDFYKINSLETVFLKLCMDKGSEETEERKTSELQQVKSIPKSLNSQDFKNGSKNNKSVTAVTGIRKVGQGPKSMLKDQEDKNVLVQPWNTNTKYGHNFSIRRSGALMIKNGIRLRRNLLYLIFSFVLPPFQTIMFCVTVGGNPHDLPVAVVDLDNHASISPIPDISNIFLDHLNHHIIKQKAILEFDEGVDCVKRGKCWGLIFFNTTYSFDTLNVLPSPNDDGTIHVYMDDTNQEISYTIKITIFAALEKTVAQLFHKFPLNVSHLYNLPLKFEPAIYPIDNSTFRNFVAPGVILTITFFMALGLTALSFIIERREGLLDRSWVAGVKPVEVMLAHLATQACILVVQIALILVFMFPVFNIPCEGSIFWVILMSLLQGFCGMSFGFMISALATDEMTAIQFILGTFYPILLISGIVWPIEGMPTFLRYISYILPQTFACEGLRAVLYRGWGIGHFEVYIGYIITIGWTAIFLVSALFAVKMKK